MLHDTLAAVGRPWRAALPILWMLAIAGLLAAQPQLGSGQGSLGSSQNTSVGSQTNQTPISQGKGQGGRVQVGPSASFRPGRPARVQRLRVDRPFVVFDLVPEGAFSAWESLSIKNVGQEEAFVHGFGLDGPQPLDFEWRLPTASLPIQLAPGEKAVVEVRFAPSYGGPRRGRLLVQGPRANLPDQRVSLYGLGLGAPGREVVLNAGGDGFFGEGAVEWTRDHLYSGGQGARQVFAAAGTSNPLLFETTRRGASFSYAFDLPAGAYHVQLYFVEPEHQAVSERVFDVHLNGERVLDDLDLFDVAGYRTAWVHTSELVTVAPGLDLELEASVGSALLAGVEVRSVPTLSTEPADLVDFDTVPEGTVGSAVLRLENPGALALEIDELAFLAGAESGESFALTLGGSTYNGGPGDVYHALDFDLAPFSVLDVPLEFTAEEEILQNVVLRFSGNFGQRQLDLRGIAGHVGHPFLHVVIQAPEQRIDYDLSGDEPVWVDGSQSHTHELGHALTGFAWTAGGGVLSTDPAAELVLPVGEHDVELVITDDNAPPEELAGSQAVRVVPADRVPGVLARIYDAGGADPLSLLDALPPQADFSQVLSNFELENDGGVGASGFQQNVVVEFLGELVIPAEGLWRFTLTGGSGGRLDVDGNPYGGSVWLAPGPHLLHARVAVSTLADLPLRILAGKGAATPILPPDSTVTHDQSLLPPVLNGMPASGSELGGETVTLSGMGFWPEDQVSVQWGSTVLGPLDVLSWDPDALSLVVPPGTGQVSVTVSTPRGTTKARSYDYLSGGPIPIVFTEALSQFVSDPTSVAWGPDGRVWVGQVSGFVSAFTLDENYQVVASQNYPGVSGLSNKDLLGIAFNPAEAAGPLRLYVSHSELFANGGSSFTGPSPYSGQVSVLTGPNFDSPLPLITGLPVSNHDHGVNGLAFDDNGDLLIAVGGNTNAGIPHPNMGDLDESPLTAAIVKAYLSLGASFDGALVYRESAGGAPNQDQVFGGVVELPFDSHVVPYAFGLRNAYDLVWTTGERLYATDNGPNFGFGQQSTGPGSMAGGPQTLDELVRVRHQAYYGHPNRNRGRSDARQNVYYDTALPSVTGVFTQALTTLPSSSDGIAEYRSNTFGGRMRGDLLVAKWGSNARRVELVPDGESVLAVEVLNPNLLALDLATLPGGAIAGADYLNNRLRVLAPFEPAPVGVAVTDIHPWRAPASGGAPFVVAGSGFGTLANTQVEIGGHLANLSAVSATRIEGTLPGVVGAPRELVDLLVRVGSAEALLPGAFRFLAPAGEATGRWENGPDMPLALGEVAGGVIGGALFLVGEGSAKTLAYDLEQELWSQNLAQRPFIGHHHGAAVVGEKLYLVGGLAGGSEGRVQIYDPVADAWSLGADMPWPGGSVSVGVIDGDIYAAGGIVGTTTVDNCAVYDPVADAWTALAPMPSGKGRNHAAGTSDGQRLWIFGGRGVGSGPGNWVANGFDDVQVYDPQSDSWDASFLLGTGLSPLPQARGGTGRAVYYQGEFYVFGGETQNGAGAQPGGVYDRVDVYDPRTGDWRLEAPLPTPRHGIWPVVFEDELLVAGGGVQAAFSSSSVFEILVRP